MKDPGSFHPDRPSPVEPLVPRRWAHATVVAQMHCRNCGYDLRGLDASSRCPECGMDVWAAVLHTVDPASSRLPSIRNPRAVGNSLVVLTLCALIGALLMAMPSVAQAIENARSPAGSRAWSGWLPYLAWPYALTLGVAGLWAIWNLAPPRGSEPHGAVWDDIWRLIVGYVGWIASAAMFATISEPQALTSRHPRLVLALAAAAFGAIGLFGLRGVLRIIGQRSREYRRLEGGRQSVELMIIAVGAAALGVIIAYLARFDWVPGRWRFGTRAVGNVVLTAGVFMLLIGLAYLVLNAVWIRRALRSPPPHLDEVLMPRMPNETWAMDRED